MGDNKTQKAVVFVTKSGLQFCGSYSKNIPSYSFDQKLVRDLDVVDVGTLQTQIQGFISQNKLVPAPVLFLFSEPICFYQDLKETDGARLKISISEFVNTVPFETVLTRVYKIKEGVRIVSINEKLYREIAQAFEASGFVSLGVVPSFVLGDRLSTATSLDANVAKQALANIDVIREQSFLAAEEVVEEEGGEEKTIEKPTGKKGFKITRNLVIFGVVFVVLIGVLIFLLLRR